MSTRRWGQGCSADQIRLPQLGERRPLPQGAGPTPAGVGMTWAHAKHQSCCVSLSSHHQRLMCAVYICGACVRGATGPSGSASTGVTRADLPEAQQPDRLAPGATLYKYQGQPLYHMLEIERLTMRDAFWVPRAVHPGVRALVAARAGAFSTVCVPRLIDMARRQVCTAARSSKG